MNRTIKVCHFTSVHRQEDVRIFHKECASLAAAGYDTYLVTCGPQYEKFGVHMAGIGDRDPGKLGRILKTAKRVYNAAVEIDADIYHFHDPELLPYGLKLKRKGKTVIFDCHEDIPGQIKDKEWIPGFLRKTISWFYRQYETHALKHFDAAIVAEPIIESKFKGRAKNLVLIQNFPKLDDIVFHPGSFAEREPIVCYAGGISENRGENIMRSAMKGVDGKLVIAGDHEIKEEDNVSYVGRLDRADLNDLYGRSVVGLCVLKPIENYYYAQPTKLYEYMLAGIPYICSDFPGWRKLSEESRCGICVDPSDIDGIRAAIKDLLNDREKAQKMGASGHDYVLENCTWSGEEKILLDTYKALEPKA